MSSHPTNLELPQGYDRVVVLLATPLEEDRVSLQHIFSHSKWKLDAVGNLQEALDFLHKHHIGVVICERNLPGGNWKVFLDAVATLAPAPRVIVSSRIADEFLWADVLNLGGYDVLSTPFDAREVFHVVHSAWLSWEWEWKLTYDRPKPATFQRRTSRDSSFRMARPS